MSVENDDDLLSRYRVKSPPSHLRQRILNVCAETASAPRPPFWRRQPLSLVAALAVMVVTADVLVSVAITKSRDATFSDNAADKMAATIAAQAWQEALALRYELMTPMSSPEVMKSSQP
jgi:hypothetical protein